MERTLTTVRAINHAVWENINARAQGVYCTKAHGEDGLRVWRARSVKGVVQVRLVGGDRWVVPERVYQPL